MLTLSAGRFTISSLSKILILFSHTGSSPLIMLQMCSSALGRIWGAVFRMLHASSSWRVFHSILFLITWTSAPGQKIQEHTHLILLVGVLLGIDLAQGNIQCMKSFRIECRTTSTIMQLCFKAALSGTWHYMPSNFQPTLRSVSHKAPWRMHPQGVLLLSSTMVCVMFEWMTVYWTFEGKGEQTLDLSWWLKPSVFRCSGLWLRFWTPWCEEWFQTQLKDIHKHKAGLRTSQEWSKALKFNLWKSGKLLRVNILASESYLAQVWIIISLQMPLLSRISTQ